MAQITYANGASLVPVPVANEIVKSAEQQSAAMQLFRRKSLSSKTEKTPVQASLPSAYWLAEGGTKQTTNMTWSDKTMTAEEIAVIVTVADNLIDDAAYDLWGEIKTGLAAAFARKIDQAVLFGTSAPTSFDDSLVEAATAAGNTVVAGTSSTEEGGIVNDVLATMEAVVTDGYEPNAFIASNRFKFNLLKARDLNGQPLLSTNGEVTNLWGNPIAYVGANIFTPGASQPLLIAFDREKAVIGVRQDITFRMSKDATVGGVSLYETDQTAIRATMRIGYSLFAPVNRIGGSGAPVAVLSSAA